MGRVTGREGVVWEYSLGCSSCGVMESTPCLSLAAAISCFPRRSEGILSPCATARSEESVCNRNAKSFQFSHLLLFPLFFHCNLTVTFQLCNSAPSHLKGPEAEFCTSLSNMLSSSQPCTPCSGSQPQQLLWVSYEKQLLPVFLSFSSPFVFWLLMYNIMLRNEHNMNNMNCLVAANRR